MSAAEPHRALPRGPHGLSREEVELSQRARLLQATTEAVADPKIRAAFAEGLRRLDASFEERIRVARDAGELGREADPAALAKLASATLHTLALRARAGMTRAELEGLARQAVTVIIGNTGSAIESNGSEARQSIS